MSTRVWFAARVTLTVVVLAGLALDAYVHIDLASTYDGVKSSVLSQGDLFRTEAALATLAAVALLVRPRRYTALFALVVTAAPAHRTIPARGRSDTAPARRDGVVVQRHIDDPACSAAASSRMVSVQRGSVDRRWNAAARICCRSG